METVEMIRDFNGWSWSTTVGDPTDAKKQILYQNLKLLLGNRFLEEWIQRGSFIIDYIENMQIYLEELYAKEKSDLFLSYLFKVLIEMMMQQEELKKQEIENARDRLEKQEEKRKDRKQFLNDLSKQKKEVMKQINYLDDVINTKERLEKELGKRNEEITQDMIPVFSISHLKEILMQERQQAFDTMKEYSKQMDPKHFNQEKERMQEKVQFIQALSDKEENIEKDFVKLQQAFLNCFQQRIEKQEAKKEDNKKQSIELIYFFRYYCQLNVEKDKQIQQIVELQESKKKIQNQLIQRAIQTKAMTTIADDPVVNQEILSRIFDLRMIELTNMEIEIQKTKQADQYEITIFDAETIETKESITLSLVDKKTGLKTNKKIPIFI